MRRFEIIEIKNGWLLSYYTEYEGNVQRYFQELDEVVYILNTIMADKKPETQSLPLKNKLASGN
jgi:hypothetical protein